MDQKHIVYSDEHWRILCDLRNEAVRLMKPLTHVHIECLIYGSLARGDVHKTSDIDVFIPYLQAVTLIEAALECEGIQSISREIVQATPGYAAKGYIYTSNNCGYSFPLVPLLPSEKEFYGFAGSAKQIDLESDVRVPGVDKRLMFIQPTYDGHIEYPIQGLSGEVAKILKVDTKIVRERIRTLERRDKVGRTGVYLKRSLAPSESFSEVLENLSQNRPGLRKRLRS